MPHPQPLSKGEGGGRIGFCFVLYGSKLYTVAPVSARRSLAVKAVAIIKTLQRERRGNELAQGSKEVRPSIDSFDESKQFTSAAAASPLAAVLVSVIAPKVQNYLQKAVGT
ncbi:MAG: hypothetical protein EZS28_042631, partial [Streblomastix strix]